MYLFMMMQGKYQTIRYGAFIKLLPIINHEDVIYVTVGRRHLPHAT